MPGLRATMLGMALAVGLPGVARAQDVRTIGIGDPSRAQLLDALRAVIAKDLGQPVKFVVDDMRVRAEWAFVVAHPQTPAGEAIDFSKTHYAERQREGVLDGDTLYALLRRRGGTWAVVDFMIGPTDVGWMDWQSTHGVPEGLIPQPGD